jgi:tyrosinase
MATKGKATAKKATKSAAKPAAAAAKTGADKSDNQMYRTSKVYKSAKTVAVDQLPPDYSRADLEFIGVDHSGASYEARVFINNPSADENTPTADANGYAGSFNIFGHGGCFGDVGHCEVNREQDDFDPRPSHPLQPIRKIVEATDAIKNAAAQSKELTITVVPVIKSWTEKTELDDVLVFDHINLVTYD